MTLAPVPHLLSGHCAQTPVTSRGRASRGQTQTLDHDNTAAGRALADLPEGLLTKFLMASLIDVCTPTWCREAMPFQFQRDSANVLAHAHRCCALLLSPPRLALMVHRAQAVGNTPPEIRVRDTQADRGTARTMVQADPSAAACLQLRRYALFLLSIHSLCANG